MTGEYYLSDESYEMEEGLSFRCNTSCHFLVKPWLEDHEEFDYLGEEVSIDFNAESMAFDLEGAHGNTSVI